MGKNREPEHELRRNLLMATYLRIQDRASEERSPSSPLSPRRLRQVRVRLDNGFYDLPGVQAEVARRLRLDLNLSPKDCVMTSPTQSLRSRQAASRPLDHSPRRRQG